MCADVHVDVVDVDVDVDVCVDGDVDMDVDVDVDVGCGMWDVDGTSCVTCCMSGCVESHMCVCAVFVT